MPAYLVMQIKVVDEALWRSYREAVLPLIARFGGKHATKKVELLEGSDQASRLAMFEFPSTEALQAFWTAPDYAPVKELRKDAAALTIWAVSGD